MDDIYILACLMQLVCVLTHTSEGMFKKKKKNHNKVVPIGHNKL